MAVRYILSPVIYAAISKTAVSAPQQNRMTHWCHLLPKTRCPNAVIKTGMGPHICNMYTLKTTGSLKHMGKKF